ncbi:CapA family protein [Pseudonocardia sp. H11422]|uniref:CapA family protein n=1 Tax=Pseudonocardia sp. H11422 TaxID=2835866 RepID=UPI001BDC484F
MGRRGTRHRTRSPARHPRSRRAAAGDRGLHRPPRRVRRWPWPSRRRYANLRHGTPDWLLDTVKAAATEADAVLVSPHWGPNMRVSPLPYVRRAAGELRGAGATLVAGHSAHVFQGVEDQILYDLGDFIDDYVVDMTLRNDLGLLFLVTLDPRPQRLEAIPLALDFCHTRLAAATGDEAAWVRQRFRSLCAEFGTDVAEHRGRLVIEWAESRTVEEDLEEALVPGGHVDNGDNDPPDVDNP